ncbi:MULTISPECIES: endonuclease/exonuclease/phosphatase family protein [unclassified Vibrio]|uniref:endonuclease/exonuclease/phosphatase family protein n=1 Tax=unclassified Vibrio TaxID=2614977 RepID=UPI001361507E|nr:MULTISPECIES: endonuclease/exonuclease/phosphatase family protein [unclassified Vibrio]NAW60349.1 endonuclease/exonuclease/phosphatase family protein [Vibrio sp. V36_P2S2PM302]NAX28294.1 endonuclease/exonuclease/phosphatase family protein [Vibrio sp. V38_P2S17PM301]NAX29095.1 endonuclease/exonuclease/phosphatase family protein [Vibrio sp. V37_P2S8PM304]
MSEPVTTLTFATMNLFNYVEPPNAFYDFGNIYTQVQWQKKCDWLERQLNQVNADVVGFQEVFSPKALQAQLRRLGYAYFATVDGPHIADDYIYTHPVVAIASRYPIESATRIQRLLSPDRFTFSREPLHAVITLPVIGHTDVYIVHFKSQRPMEGELLSDTTSECVWRQELAGRWQSSIQRGWEAHCLHQSLVTTKQQSQRPCLVMGDFNADYHSGEFAALRSNGPYRQDPQPYARYHLHDAWHLFSDQEVTRPFTHYAGPQGSVLDYILVSDEFRSSSSFCLADILRYQVIDKHLVNPDYAIDGDSSDHALVALSVTCRAG